MFSGPLEEPDGAGIAWGENDGTDQDIKSSAEREHFYQRSRAVWRTGGRRPDDAERHGEQDGHPAAVRGGHGELYLAPVSGGAQPRGRDAGDAGGYLRRVRGGDDHIVQE